MTADTELRPALYFGTSAQFWLGLQNDFDIEEVQISKKYDLEKIKQYKGLKEETI